MTTETTGFVAYYRVSTEKQGESGLGLAAQKSKVREYVERNGNGYEIVAEFEEVESGTNGKRPKLEEALRACRLNDAELVVAKLDRLARDAGLIHRLRDSSVEIHFADMPEASDLSVSVLAAVAEHEAKQISKRTKAALANYDGELGRPENFSDEGRRKGGKVSGKVRAEKADQYARDVADILEKIEAEADHDLTLREKAERLENYDWGNGHTGVRRPQGGSWSAMAVSRLEDRIEGLESEG